MDQKIQRLIETSKSVLLDCCLDNGAIVAANSTKPYYPKDAKNYFYVWPRDASFTCIALDILGISGPQERFFDWLVERSEGWKDRGLWLEKYYPNGLQVPLRNRFQPDQTGVTLFAVAHHCRRDRRVLKKFQALITRSARGLCSVWKKDHFSVVTNDVWEQRLTFPDCRENFTYSLAACARGLLLAHKLFPNKVYEKTSREMIAAILKNAKRKGYFFRSFGTLDDERIDASLLGLIWPFSIVTPTSTLAKQTVRRIEKMSAQNFGVYRYEHDDYDGWIYETQARKKQSGFWPLLNFWMAIVLNRMGEKKRALRYYDKVVASINQYIPEQIFSNSIQQSVSPLCWSHAMFIIASKELGHLPL